MSEVLRETVFETFAEVFETMFFTVLETFEEPPGKKDFVSGRFVEATIGYSGGCNGRFVFYLPWELARNITVNFLGIEEDEVQEAQIMDTAAETANMAIGSLLGKLDPGGSASLGIPKVRELADFAPQALLDDPGLFMFNTDYGILLVAGAHAG